MLVNAIYSVESVLNKTAKGTAYELVNTNMQHKILQMMYGTLK